MSKTLLDGINDVLKRVGEIAGDSGTLSSLTDSARQTAIDVAVQVWNEAIEEMYSTAPASLPNEGAESTITLVANTRNYSLASDLLQLRFPLIDKTNNQYIFQYPGEYQKMLIDDPEQDDTGLPHFAAIRPTDGQLWLDRAPTSAENGRVYTYQYDKDVSLSLAADTMPFSDAVYRALVPAVAQLWNRDRKQTFDAAIFRASMGRAGRYLTQKPLRSSYNPR